MKGGLFGATIAMLLVAVAGVPTGSVPGVTGVVDLGIRCTPQPPDMECTYTASVTDPSLIFFRFDLRGDDGIWDYPDQTGGGSIGKWTTMNTAYILYHNGDVPDRACVQAWDGVSVRYENGVPVPDAIIDCTDVPTLSAPPVADAGGPYVGWEGSPIVFNASASTDPDGDALTFRWDFEDDGTWDTDWSSSPYAEHTWGDDWVGQARVEVSDGNSTANATADVTVLNVGPAIAGVQAFVTANLTLRVAGTKWAAVQMNVTAGGTDMGGVRVVRTPGSPDDEAATMPNVRIDLLVSFEIVVTYTPDRSANGPPNGANPAWVILTLPDGSEVRFHHTFNVRHPDTWTWTLDDLRPHLVGQAVTFSATASDPGSDDLTFAWDFGDGATATTTHYNNGVSPDPFPSPEVNPITATDVATHAFAAGTHAVTLTVTDDDGGTAQQILVLDP